MVQQLPAAVLMLLAVATATLLPATLCQQITSRCFLAADARRAADDPPEVKALGICTPATNMVYKLNCHPAAVVLILQIPRYVSGGRTCLMISLGQVPVYMSITAKLTLFCHTICSIPANIATWLVCCPPVSLYTSITIMYGHVYQLRWCWIPSSWCKHHRLWSWAPSI